MIDSTKGKVFWIAVGLAAAAIAVAALFSIFRGYLRDAQDRAPVVPTSYYTNHEPAESLITIEPIQVS